MSRPSDSQWQKRLALWPYAVAAVVALPLLYVLSDGLGIYAVGRGWMEWSTFEAVWGPLPELFGDTVVDAYEGWWWEQAERQGAAGP